MAKIPIRRKRFLGLPPWFIPVLILFVVATGWMVLAGDDEDDGDVIEAGPAHASVPEVPEEPALPPAYRPAVPSVAPGTLTEQATTEAAIAAGTAAGAAAGAAAGRAVLASVGDVSRTIRQSASTAGVLNGRPVQIAGAVVSGVVSDRAFYVGAGSDRLMVVIDPPTATSPVRAGDRVSLTGTLETYAPRVGETGVGEGGYVVVAPPGSIVR